MVFFLVAETGLEPARVVVPKIAFVLLFATRNFDHCPFDISLYPSPDGARYQSKLFALRAQNPSVAEEEPTAQPKQKGHQTVSFALVAETGLEPATSGL